MTTTSPASRRICAAARTASAPEDACAADAPLPLAAPGPPCASSSRPGMKPCCARALRASSSREADSARGRAERRRQGGQGGLGCAWGEPQRRRGRVVERRRAARRHHEPGAVAADRLAHAQVEDRRLVHQLGVQHEDRVRVVDVGDPGRQVHARERAREGRVRRSATGGDVAREPRPCRSRCCTRKPSSFVAWPPTRATVPGPRALEQRGRLVDRPLPARLAQEAADSHQRRRDPLGRVERLVAEAALVAEPPVVDLVVVAREHADDLRVVADGELHVALRRAERADRAGVLDVPGPRAEAIRRGGERAHRAELDDVPAERRRRTGARRACPRRCGRRGRGTRAGGPRPPPARSARSGSRGCSARGRSPRAATARAAS